MALHRFFLIQEQLNSGGGSTEWHYPSLQKLSGRDWSIDKLYGWTEACGSPIPPSHIPSLPSRCAANFQQPAHILREISPKPTAK